MRKAERVTVTMPADLAAALRRLAEGEVIESVSGYVCEAVRARMASDRHLAELDARMREHWSEQEVADGLAWARRELGTGADSGETRAA